MEDINYDELDPGIREHVRALRCQGFDTIDSGDGISKQGMECACEHPNIAIALDDEAELRVYALAVLSVLSDIEPGWSVEASYGAHDGKSFIFCYRLPQS